MIKEMLQQQYDWVKESRQVLLQYCDTIKVEDFLKENSSFGRGSIRNLLTHIANTYEFWIAKKAIKKEIEFTRYVSVNNVNDIRIIFHKADQYIAEFLELYSIDYSVVFNIEVNGKQVAATAQKLFTHVTTHEFHHKGQVLSLSRHLGYVPVDTDVMR